MLQVIEEAWDTLDVNDIAEELIEKSNQAIQAEQQKELEQQQRLEKTRQQRTVFLTIGLIVAVVLSIISFSSNSRLDKRNHSDIQSG